MPISATFVSKSTLSTPLCDRRAVRIRSKDSSVFVPSIWKRVHGRVVSKVRGEMRGRWFAHSPIVERGRWLCFGQLRTGSRVRWPCLQSRKSSLKWDLWQSGALKVVHTWKQQWGPLQNRHRSKVNLLWLELGRVESYIGATGNQCHEDRLNSCIDKWVNQSIIRSSTVSGSQNQSGD